MVIIKELMNYQKEMIYYVFINKIQHNNNGYIYINNINIKVNVNVVR